MAKSGIEFSQFQRELDDAFHSRLDRIPAGTPEHAELMTFAQRFLMVRWGVWAGFCGACLVAPSHIPDEETTFISGESKMQKISRRRVEKHSSPPRVLKN